MRLPTPAGPAEIGTLDGLAYTLWLPDADPWGGVVIVHGAGSAKESHHDFARAARAAGMGAVCFDQRGHGDSAGALDDRLLVDVRTMAGLLPATGASGDRIPVALRGSSLGGYVALLAADVVDAAAVVAICPAGAEHLRRSLDDEALSFRVEAQALDRFLAAHDVRDAVAALDVPVMLLHAEGDERIPVEHSRALFAAARSPLARLVALPGGHHRSVQHDAELQGEALRFLRRALTGPRGDASVSRRR